MPNGKVARFAFDAAGAATGYTPPGAGAWARSFDDDGLLTGLTLPGGARLDLQREPRPAARPASPTPPARASSTFALAATAPTVQTEATRTLPGGRSDTERDRARRRARDRAASRATRGGAYATLRATTTATTCSSTRSSCSPAPTPSRTRDLARRRRAGDRFGPFTLTRGGPLGRRQRDHRRRPRSTLGYDGRGRAERRARRRSPARRVYDTHDHLRRRRTGSPGKVEKIGGVDAAPTPTRTRPTASSTTVTRDGDDGRGPTPTTPTATARDRAAPTYADDDVLDARRRRPSYTFDAAGFLTARGARHVRLQRRAASCCRRPSAARPSPTPTTRSAAASRASRAAQTTRYLYGDPRRAAARSPACARPAAR